jgi:hypothetical protein
MRPCARLKALLPALFLCLVAAPAVAQSMLAASSREPGLRGNKAVIMLAATLPPELRLSLSTVQLDIIVSNPAEKSAVVEIPLTSSWVLNSEANHVEVVGFFDSSEAALTDNAGHAIPAGHVLGGTAAEGLMPFNESSSVGTVNRSRTFFQQRISRDNVVSRCTGTLRIQMAPIANLNLPAGEYRGVLHLRLIAY